MIILLSRWFVANKLTLTTDKTCYSIFGTQESRQDLEVKINHRRRSRASPVLTAITLVNGKPWESSYLTPTKSTYLN